MITAATLAACGGGGGGGGGGDTTPTPTPPPVTVVSAPTGSPITSFTQSVVSNDTGTFNEVFPGQANVWSLDPDFSLVDGFDDQFNWALALTVGGTAFPADQLYSQLTFTGPFMGSADGVKVAAVSNGSTMASSINALAATPLTIPLAGSYSAFLNATSDSRLQQTVDLTSAAGTVTVTWHYAVSLDPGDIDGYMPSFNVVARNVDGTICETLFVTPNPASTVQSKSLIPSCTGKTIVLSFEEKSSTNAFSQSYAIIDDVSVKDSSGKEFVVNGDFASGALTPWTTNTPVESQNVTSGVRNLEGLDVKRSFYTVPNKLWGRWVDVFENHTGGTITKTVTYETSLGSDGAGIIYYAPGTSNKALTAWDNQTGDRDVGLVFGNANPPTFTPDDGTGNVGNALITVTYNISVPAGSSVALVNFVIMDGTDTGLANPGTTNTGAKATEIDTEAAKIVANFWTDPQYTVGMTPEQILAIQNFSH